MLPQASSEKAQVGKVTVFASFFRVIKVRGFILPIAGWTPENI